MSSFRAAIVGGGFCGVALAWHLLQKFGPKQIDITLFDHQGIAGGASGIAAGLLHPFSGAHAKLNRLGREGVKASQELLQVASDALAQPVFTTPGILRLALSEQQKQDFTLCAKHYPEEVQWLSEYECQSLFPPLVAAPGIWIKRGMIVNSPLYLKGLWTACERLGATIKKQWIEDLGQLKDFDARIIANGANARLFPELASYKLTTVKGQILELAWPAHLPLLTFALNSQAYILMTSPSTCIVGATFEKDPLTDQPDWEIAQKDILPKAAAILPDLLDAPILKCQAGFRSVTPNHLPLITEVRPRTWVITGMGSKGLLYHALMAKSLVDAFERPLTKLD